MACATLHNMRIHYNLPIHEEELADEQINQNIYENIEIPNTDQQGGPRAVAKRIQRHILDQFDHLRDGEEED